jgi:hypothetical protein
MRNVYVFKTSVGPFYIAEHEGRFHPRFMDESLGSYVSPEQAADDLAGGHTWSAPNGVDTASLGIPDDLREWTRITANPPA